MAKALLALLILAFCPARAWAQPVEIAFGLIASGSPQSILGAWGPLLDDMSAAAGVRVRAQVFEDYAGVVWAMGAGKVDLAWMGNKAAIEAVDRAGAQVAVKSLNALGQDGYHAQLIAAKDSPLHGVDDVLAKAPGLVFGNGDPNSTSGYVVPGYYIFAARGLDPRRLFKRTTQANHEENFLAVAEGRADVATGNDSDLRRLAERFPDKFSRIKVIWSSPLIPSDPIVWRRDLPPAVKDRVRDFLLGYARPAAGKSDATLAREREVMAQIKWSGFAPSDDGQLKPIRQLDLFRQRLRVEADPALSAEQRAARLQELDGRLRLLDNP